MFVVACYELVTDAPQYIAMLICACNKQSVLFGLCRDRPCSTQGVHFRQGGCGVQGAGWRRPLRRGDVSAACLLGCKNPSGAVTATQICSDKSFTVSTYPGGLFRGGYGVFFHVAPVLSLCPDPLAGRTQTSA